MMRVFALSAGLAVSCGSPVIPVLSGGDDPGTSGSTVDTMTGGATTTSTDSIGSSGQSSATLTSSSVTTSPKVDAGVPTTGETGKACNGQVDVIFLISETKATEAQLAAEIPKFAAIMLEEFSDLDLHVMIVDPDGQWGDNACPKGMCPEDGGCVTDPDYPCWALYDDDALTKCDDTRGAGVIFPAGKGTMDKPCGLDTGDRFLSGDDPDFTERFTCLTQVGSNTTSYIKHGVSLGQALSWDLRLGCNQGFLRDDALLLAVQLVSNNNADEYGPLVWADLVLEAKGYEQDLVVALAFAWEWTGYQPKPVCEGVSVDVPSSFAEWAFYFDHHVFASRCEPDYGPFFADAAAMAADLCTQIPK